MFGRKDDEPNKTSCFKRNPLLKFYSLKDGLRIRPWISFSKRGINTVFFGAEKGDFWKKSRNAKHCDRTAARIFSTANCNGSGFATSLKKSTSLGVREKRNPEIWSKSNSNLEKNGKNNRNCWAIKW